MIFANPQFFLLLLLLPLLIWRLATGKEKSIIYSDVNSVKKAQVAEVSDGRYLLGGMKILALTLIIIALARPQWGQIIGEYSTRGIDIIICLDTSGSMKTVDVREENLNKITLRDLEKLRNRVDSAREVAKNFILQRKNDRIGLVVFASISFTQCPLTIDHSALLELLDKVRAGMTGTDATAIGNAIITSVNRLKKSDGKSKIMILLTDGRNNTGEVDPLTAAKVAKTLGIKIYTIGCGARGGGIMPVENPFGGRQWVRVREDLDEETLREIASITDGAYFRAEDEDALAGIFNQINKMEKSDIKTITIKRYLERYHLLLIPALILLFLEAICRNTIYRKIP